MTQVKIVREHDRTASKRIQAFVVAVFFAFIAFLAFFSDASPVQKGVILIALFILAVISCVSVTKGVQTSNCPQCWDELEPSLETEGRDKKSILRMCMKCNVLWDVSR